jgi:hypothetical protein
MAAIRTASAFRRTGLAAIAAGAVLAAHPARAAEPSIPAEALVRAALPWSPVIFDLAVTAARSFAEITYDSRGYDAVTRSFNVSGLRVKRYFVDVSIDRLRTDLKSLILEGIEVDTRGLGLPSPLREALRELGGNSIEGSILIGVESDAARAGYDITMRYDLPSVGALEVKAALDGFHVLVPLPSSDTVSYSPEPTVTGAVSGASVAFEDYGLLRVVYKLAAQENGISPEQFKLGMLALPPQVAAQGIERLPGGASDALRQRIYGWAATVEAFLRNEDAIRLDFTPAEPVQLSRLQTGFVDEKLIVDLNPVLTPTFAAPLPAPAQPGTVAAAVAEIAGDGVPQDRAAGVSDLLRLADNADRSAIAALAANLGATSAPAGLDASQRATLYKCLLVGRAFGHRVEDTALAELTAGLDAAAVFAAEVQSMGLFSQLGGQQPVTPAEVGKHDPDALRGFAYDFYEGRKVPRNFTAALVLAQIASAAGDSFAAKLRDDLIAASDRGSIVIDAGSAQSETDRIWRMYQEAKGLAPKP